MRYLRATRAGFSLVEVVLSAALLGLLVTALVGVFVYGEESTSVAGRRAQAVLMAREGLEAVRNMRDADFSSLTSGSYGLAVNSNHWIFSGAQDSANGFTRQTSVLFIDGVRTAVTSTVTWTQTPQRQGSVSLGTRFTNWRALGTGDWSAPLQIASLDFSGAQDGVKIQTVGSYLYIVRNSPTANFLIISVTNPASPVLVGSLMLAGTPTNIAVSGTRAYVSNTDNAAELQIVDISSSASPSLLGTYDAPGTANASGVYASGTTVYLVRASSANNEFSIITAVNPAAPSLVGSLNLGANANEVVTSGTVAYVASGHDSQELQVISLVNPAAPTLLSTLDLSGSTDAVTIALTGTTILIGKSSTLSTINVVAPASPVLLGSYNATAAVNDISLATGNGGTYVYLATNSNTTEFQTVTIATPATPTLVGSVNVAGTTSLFGVCYEPLLDRAFAVGGSNTEELTVFAPQ